MAKISKQAENSIVNFVLVLLGLLAIDRLFLLFINNSGTINFLNGFAVFLGILLLTVAFTLLLLMQEQEEVLFDFVE